MSQFKILLMAKRRPGMTVAEFRAYYEDHHAPFAAEQAAGLSRYVRRYLDPQPHPETGTPAELPYDVVTELWFSDRRTFEGTLAYLTTTIMPDRIVEDEARLFDRSSFRIATVIECETELPAARTDRRG